MHENLERRREITAIVPQELLQKDRAHLRRDAGMSQVPGGRRCVRPQTCVLGGHRVSIGEMNRKPMAARGWAFGPSALTLPSQNHRRARGRHSPKMKVKVAHLKVVSNSLLITPWTIQFMEFSRPEYWTGSPFPSQGIFRT